MRVFDEPTKFRARQPQKQEVAGRPGVRRSAELVRVRDLPRRSLDEYDEAFAEAFSLSVVRPGSKFRFFVNQVIMFMEAVENGGLISFDPVGGGKTTASCFFGLVFGVERFVILCPATMRHELDGRVVPRLRKEADFAPPTVISYSQLQDPRFDDILDKAAPEVIAADEFHYLKNKNAARTKRFIRYLDAHPETIVIAMSGTGMRKSIRDFWEIMLRTHKGAKAPITRSWKDAQDWALALDPGVRPDERLAPGALLEFTRPGEDAREGYSRRLFDTCGVVGKNQTVDCPASLIMRPRAIEVPEVVYDALQKLRMQWELPSGELIVDALDFWRAARELAQGFYYEWRWPNGVVDHEWLDARKNWRAAVASVTKLNRPKLDSELLVRNAAEREANGAEGEWTRLPKSSCAAVVQAWRDWERVADRPKPPTVAVWLSDFFARSLLDWKPVDGDGRAEFGVCWIDSQATREKLGELSPDSYFVDAGEAEKLFPFDPSHPEAAFEALRKKHRVAFVSMGYHYGKNLQRVAHSYSPLPPSAGATWEQKLGRFHRSGQEADEVTCEYSVHTEELEAAVKRAVEDAEALQKTTGAQRLLVATWIGGRPE